MTSARSILWTEHALDELEATVQYLHKNFSEKEVVRLAEHIESVLRTISRFPEIYPSSFQKAGVRRAVIERFNTLYYRDNVEKNQIEILSFFSNRNNPQKLEL